MTDGDVPRLSDAVLLVLGDTVAVGWAKLVDSRLETATAGETVSVKDWVLVPGLTELTCPDGLMVGNGEFAS